MAGERNEKRFHRTTALFTSVLLGGLAVISSGEKHSESNTQTAPQTSTLSGPVGIFNDDYVPIIEELPQGKVNQKQHYLISV